MAVAKKAAPAAKTPTSSKNLPAVKAKTDVVVANGIDLGEDAGMGFENTDKDSFAIPFLRILQGQSPQCNKANPEYIKGAEQGSFYNTVTKEVIPVDESTTIELLLCHYDRKFTEWAPNRGGFRGEHHPSEPILQKAVEKINDEGKRIMVLPNGNSIQDTRYHFCLRIKEDGSTEPVLASISSSGIKKSKRLLTELNGLKLRNAEGRLFTPPMFLSVIHATTVAESNDEGDWFNWDFTVDRKLDINNEGDAELYMQAKAFRDSVAKGAVKVVHDEGGEPGAQEQF
jgi:hypothetical protein